jgi:hypothetical protein
MVGHMSTFFTKLFSEEARLRSSAFRYGLLAIIVALLVAHAFIPTRHFCSGFVVPLMLLFNHLAFSFHWSRPVTVALRLTACLWIVFGGILILCPIFTSQ